MRRRARIFLLLAVACGWAAPAPANEFEQVWHCTLNPGHTLDDARVASAEWLRAARTLRGGKDLDLGLRWPIVVADSAERFEFVLRAPSLETWGEFYDRYDPSSVVGKADEAFARVASCSGSSLWELILVDEPAP
jgi:hypothetical protein